MKKISLIVPETTKFVSMTFEVKSPNEKVHSHDTDCVVSTYMISPNDDGKLPSEVQIDMDWIDSICVKESIYVDGQAAAEWGISRNSDETANIVRTNKD